MVNEQDLVRRIGSSLVGAAQDAENHGRYREAADAYMTAFCLATRYEHGSLIYFLNGAAIEKNALRQIRTLIPKLSADELISFASELQLANHERLPFDEIIRRENYFAARNAINIIHLARARLSSQGRRSLEKSQHAHRDLQTQLKGISAAAATLAYHREN